MDEIGSKIHREDGDVVDLLADQFEREFATGDRPRIEAYLQRHPELGRHLLARLLDVEQRLRRAAGEQPDADEYLQRFPDHLDLTVASHLPTQTVETVVESGGGPKFLGRYEVHRVLGRGGFGVVYLARDPKLDRPVALKVPRQRRFQSAEQVAEFVKEARTAAQLNHPRLVSVYDVQEQDGLPYIVQEFIDGQNLKEWADQHQPSFARIARVLANVAEAVGYAHQQGLIHCDLKLANVLMDNEEQPHVTDFGLAVDESVQVLLKGQVFGTPAAMAPEQVRGESHRFDGRTDVWAMGVMLYQLLCGQQPFSAEDLTELYAEIQSHDPKPLRQIDRSVPRELERICLKCLSKRQADRYSTANDLQEDLLVWLEDHGEDASVKTAVTRGAAADSEFTSVEPVRIIPKGLRSFDQADADFFLELLPGPRDRSGLPESIHFWKSRVEETDADRTFSVGLIYGPSGCGKSSLVKAGLLPRLSGQVLSIHVEATAEDTESRLLKELHKHIPRLATRTLLPEVCADLRREGAGRNRKVLLVIDQFEQWLHTHDELKTAQLIDALRQCEGGRLQAILLVRDDFFASVHRLFHELEHPLVEGHNYALVDRFDKDHARRVLIALGRAYGKLGDELSREQNAFLDRAIDQLAEDNKVISVRLALFADMMKARPWVRASIDEVERVGGVGVTFLQETFSARTAPPPHRVHEEAVRRVLKVLLPETQTDIKGCMRSVAQLRVASDYADKSGQFTELIQILDNELRLIAPTEPDSPPAKEPGRKQDAKYYQLTHDYLVPAIREWLNRRGKETRRGRAELRLEERSTAWNARPEVRNLPSWWEYLNIRIFTKTRSWTPPQRKMMVKAGTTHGIRFAVVVSLLLVFGLAARQVMALIDERLDTAVDAMAGARGYRVPVAIDKLKDLEFPDRSVIEKLNSRFADGEPDQKRAVAYALAEYGKVYPDALLRKIANAPSSECLNIVTALEHARDDAVKKMLELAAEAEVNADGQKLKGRLAVVALHLGDPTIAIDVHKVRPDPAQQTYFIHDVFPIWYGDLERLAEQVERLDKQVDKPDYAALRAGMCLAVANLEQFDVDVPQKWLDLMSYWYRNAPDAGTHGAAGWGLRKLVGELPTIPPNTNRGDWKVTEHGFTMVRIPAGRFERVDEGATTRQSVTLRRDFWLSDTEVSVGLYRRFLDAQDEWWPEPSEIHSPTDQHPAQRTTWEGAVSFCNWLSRVEGKKPCYEIQPLEGAKPEDRQTLNVKLLPDGTGYRLPTEAEWEYACRAGSVTEYSFGNDLRRYLNYAAFATTTEVVGSKMCNRWGLFDMHGNVWEWCYDRWAKYSEQPVTDPLGSQTGDDRVNRGGAFDRSLRWAQSSRRGLRVPRHERPSVSVGLRLAQYCAAD